MNYKDHIALGAITGIGCAYLAQYTPEVMFFIGISIGSLLPDIDHPKSKISRLLFPISWVFKPVKHRSITHSLLGLYLLIELMWKWWHLSPQLFDGVMIGYVSHLIGDMLGYTGIPLAYPIKKRIKI